MGRAPRVTENYLSNVAGTAENRHLRAMAAIPTVVVEGSNGIVKRILETAIGCPYP